MIDPEQQVFYFFMICGLVTLAFLVSTVHARAVYKKNRRRQNDRIVQQMLDEMRDQRIEELREQGAFRHPRPNGKVINVDFTEAIIDVEEVTGEHIKPTLEYKLVYDEVYGVYRKVRR